MEYAVNCLITIIREGAGVQSTGLGNTISTLPVSFVVEGTWWANHTKRPCRLLIIYQAASTSCLYCWQASTQCFGSSRAQLEALLIRFEDIDEAQTLLIQP